MATREKAVQRLKSVPVDYKWQEAKALLVLLDFKQRSGSGSRVKFYHPDLGHVISLHRPHPKPEMKRYAVRELLQALKEYGLIK